MTNKNTRVTLIESPHNDSFFYEKIIDPINNYLVENKGAVGDFNLIKDIVDRQIDVKEEEITGNLPIPLYLGLIGTMIGIIISLFFVSENDFSNLLIGVQIALVASAIGIIATAVNSYFFFKAKSEVENKKNDFFTFIQTQLLPDITQSTTSALHMLQSNLVNFNKTFSRNIEKFDETIGGIGVIVDGQVEIFKEIQKIDFSKIARAAKGMEKSFEKLQELSVYLNGVNGFLNSTNQLNLTVNEQLNKVGQIYGVVEAFERNATDISEGSRFLRTYFEDVDSKQSAFNRRMANFDSGVQDMLGALKQSFLDKLEEFRNSDIHHATSFENVFMNFRQQFTESFTAMNEEFQKGYKRVHKDFKDLFSEIKNSSQEVFEDEQQNIAGIHNKLGDLTTAITSMAEATSSLSKLKETVETQVEQMAHQNKLLESSIKKSGKSRIPLGLRITVFIASGVVVATCAAVILKVLKFL